MGRRHQPLLPSGGSSSSSFLKGLHGGTRGGLAFALSIRKASHDRRGKNLTQREAAHPLQPCERNPPISPVKVNPVDEETKSALAVG